MAALPDRELDLDERIVVRVPADPHVRVDTNDYSLDPRWSAAASRSASPSARSPPSAWTPASSRAGTSAASPSTARSPRSSTRGLFEHRPQPEHGLEVQVRPLSAYDQLIA